jgi:dephospho-CoA kinase
MIGTGVTNGIDDRRAMRAGDGVAEDRTDNRRALRVGVTGGIGSGKSAVCKILAEWGTPVYCSDLRARELMIGRGEIRRAVVELLGPEAYRGDMPDSAYIASKVFTDRMLLSSLNSIVHPAVALDFEGWTLAFADRPYVVFESAILYESGFDRFVDRVVTVSAPADLRLERVLARGHGGVSREDVMRRMAGQLSDADREARAWRTIDNSGTLDELAARVQLLDKELQL